MGEKFKNYIKVEGDSELFDEKYGFKNIDSTQLLELCKDDSYIPYVVLQFGIYMI